MRTAVIGLGSNLGDRLATLSAAAEKVALLGTDVRRSPVYETAPLGPPQPDYLNAVMLLSTDRDPEALLQALLDIEVSLGRERRERWGPRTIDLDLLMLGDVPFASPRLTLPHPEIPNRPFVLQPWVDLAPDMRIPGLGTPAEMLAGLSDEAKRGVRLFLERW